VDWQMQDRKNSSEFSSPEASGGINPWSKNIRLLIWGLIFTQLTLDFLWLQYILPTIGILLLYLSARSMRQENAWFRAAWGIIIVKLAFHIVGIMVISTPLIRILLSYELLIGYCMVALDIALLLVLRKAFRTVFDKADMAQEKDPLLWAAIWTILVALIAHSPFAESWLVFIPMIVFYIIIMRNLYHLGGRLDVVDDTFCPAPIKMSGRWIVQIYVGVCIVTFIVCSIVSNHLTTQPLDFTPPREERLLVKLEEMEFPRHILLDLKDDELQLFEGAVRLQVEQDLFELPAITIFSSPRIIEVTTIYIELPQYTLYMLNHFRWQGRSVFWHDGIGVRGDAEPELEIVRGRLLYEKNGETNVSAFPRLNIQNVEHRIVFGSAVETRVSGVVSFPLFTENQRGYILTRQQGQERFLVAYLFEYVHNAHHFQLPYRKTEQRMIDGEFFMSRRLMQVYTLYDLARTIPKAYIEMVRDAVTEYESEVE